MELEAQIIKPFGPSIMKVKIPEDIVNKLNDYIDKIVSDKKKSNELNYGNNLAGDVTQEFKLEQNFIKETGWLDFLAKSTFQYVKSQTKKNLKQFNLLDTWIVRQFKNEYNPVHWHGGHISGAGFLKIPESFGNYTQNKGDKHYSGGTLNLIHGSMQFLSNSVFEIRPEVGDFYFFPNYLMHTVYPFKGTDEERRSISFNGIIDKSIYDVYADYAERK